MLKKSLLKQNKIFRYTVILISIGLLMYGYALYRKVNPFIKYLEIQNTTEQGTINIYNNNRKHFDNVYSYCKTVNGSPA